MSQNHDDIAARLRDEASATAPERLRADVMVRVRAEPRPQRLRTRRRSFRRSFATVAAAACILGAMVFGLSRVDFGGGSASGGAGASAARELTQGLGAAGGGTPPALVPGTSTKRALYGADGQAVTPAHIDRALRAAAVPRPLRAAILGRYSLAPPLRKAFGAIDPHQGPNRR